MTMCSDEDYFYIDARWTYDDLGTLDGCYGDSGYTEQNLPEYFRDTIKSDDAPVVLASDQFTTVPMWVLAHYDAIDTSFFVRCRDASLEDASLIHPTEVVQWDCRDDDGEFTRLDAVEATCGCPSTSSASETAPTPTTSDPTPAPLTPPIPAPTPTPLTPPTPAPTPISLAAPSTPSTPAPTPIPEPSDPSSCGATESFRIKSGQLPEAEGCFQATQESFSNPGANFEVWTVSGNTQYNQFIVAGLADDGTGEVSDSPYMLAYFGEEEGDRIGYCMSNEDAITVHPADATWLCDLSGSAVGVDNGDILNSMLGGGPSATSDTPASFVAVTDGDISFECGCTTPAPVQPEPTPSPSPSPSPASSSSVPLGVAIGGAVGGTALLALVGGLLLLAKRRRDNSKGHGSSPSGGGGKPPVVWGDASGGGKGSSSGRRIPPPAYSGPPPPEADLVRPVVDGGAAPPPPYSDPPLFSG